MAHDTDSHQGANHARENREFESAIDKQSRRRIRAMQDGHRGVLYWVGMFGLVGWSVALPTTLGAVAGIYIDKQWESSISWTLTLLIAGLMFGCTTAWRWLRMESEETVSETKPKQNDESS